MSKKLLRILYRLSREIRDNDFNPPDIIDMIQYDDLDFENIQDEIEGIEVSGSLDEDSLDIFRALLVYILIRDSALEKEEIYSLVFGKGQEITWH